MVDFYNKGDQEIYKDYQFVPQEKYRTGFTAPTTEEEVTESFGIPATNAFTNSDGSVNYYSGNPNSLVEDFQSTVDARQERLNNPSDTFLGFNTMTNPPTEASTILAQNIGSLPQEQTMMGKVQSFLTPQSAQSIIDDGYNEPRFQPGIIGTIMGKLDNYRNLSPIDQSFIAQNMGYTGPTVFGENNSGLGKDPFGINTRSALGNYGEYVGKAVTDLEEALEKAKGKDMYNIGGKFNKSLFNKNTKLMQTKLAFYQGKVKEREAIKNAQIAEAEQQINPTGPSNAPGGTPGGSPDNWKGTTYDNSAGDFRNADGSNVSQDFKNTSASLDNYDASALYAKGGRVGYKHGGLASIL